LCAIYIDSSSLSEEARCQASQFIETYITIFAADPSHWGNYRVTLEESELNILRDPILHGCKMTVLNRSDIQI